MMHNESNLSEAAAIKRRAFATWDNEGGAKAAPPHMRYADIPALGDAEIIQLRIRVIALENLMIALLSAASDSQLQIAADMGAIISPRPGFTQHPLTIHAAEHMDHMIARAAHFRELPWQSPSEASLKPDAG